MNRLKELRRAHGYKTQQDLANVLSVNQTAVSQWERGVTIPSSQMLLKLSAMYGVSIDYLLGRADEDGNVTVGSRIRFERERLGLTPKQLATRSGIEETSVQRFESGQDSPTSCELETIASVLGVSALALAGFDGPTGQRAVFAAPSGDAPPEYQETVQHAVASNPRATIDVVDDDLREYLDELRRRPEKKLLFSVTKNASKSQIEAIVKMIEEMQGAK